MAPLEGTTLVPWPIKPLTAPGRGGVEEPVWPWGEQLGAGAWRVPQSRAVVGVLEGGNTCGLRAFADILVIQQGTCRYVPPCCCEQTGSLSVPSSLPDPSLPLNLPDIYVVPACRSLFQKVIRWICSPLSPSIVVFASASLPLCLLASPPFPGAPPRCGPFPLWALASGTRRWWAPRWAAHILSATSQRRRKTRTRKNRKTCTS